MLIKFQMNFAIHFFFYQKAIKLLNRSNYAVANSLKFAKNLQKLTRTHRLVYNIFVVFPQTGEYIDVPINYNINWRILILHPSIIYFIQSFPSPFNSNQIQRHFNHKRQKTNHTNNSTLSIACSACNKKCHQCKLYEIVSRDRFKTKYSHNEIYGSSVSKKKLSVEVYGERERESVWLVIDLEPLFICLLVC